MNASITTNYINKFMENSSNISRNNSRMRRERELRYKKLLLLKLGIVTVSVIILFMIFGAFIVDASSKKVEEKLDRYYTSITIEDSMTLTDIADKYCSYGNKNSYMSDIMKLNNMTTDTLYAGQDILIIYYQ